jgi:hypothetical protein
MRPPTTLVLCTTLTARLLSAQTTADRWSFQVAVTRDAFQGASADTTTIPGSSVEVVPAPRLAFEAGASRGLGAWEVGLSGGYSAGALRAKTDALLVEDRSGDVTRIRASLSLGRRLATFGSASLLILAGPALDHWKTSGVGDRTTVSARVGLALRIPLGPVRLENLVSFGVGESPFRHADLPAEAQVRTLRTWSFGLGLRIPIQASPRAT